jgi:acetyl esterase/lipase
MTRALLGNLGDPTQPYAFAGEHDPAGLPPTLIINAEVDSLRASGEAFGSSLRHARIATDVMTEPGSEHGYLNEPSDPASARTIDWIAKWLSQVGSRREHRTQREANSKEMGCY